MLAGVEQDAPAPGVALLGARDDVAQGEGAAALGEHGQQHPGTDVHLEAAPVAAPAHRAVLVDGDVADLARDARAPVHDPPPEDPPAAHAVGDPKVRDGVVPDGGPEPGLGERAEVGVVVHGHGRAELGLQDLGHHDAVPAAHHADRRDAPRAHVHGRGHADADGEELVGGCVDGRDHLLDEQGGALQPGVRAVVGGQGHALVREDAHGRVGERDAHGPGAEVDACDEPEVARERDLERAAAAARGRRGVQHARTGELLDDVGDGGRGQPGDAGQLDLREGATLLDGAHDPSSVGLTQ